MLISFGSGPMPVAADEAVTGPVKGRGSARDGQAFGDQIQSLLGAWFGGSTAFDALDGEQQVPVDRKPPAKGQELDTETAATWPKAADEDPALPAFALTVADQAAWMRPAAALNLTAPPPAADALPGLGPAIAATGTAHVPNPEFDAGSSQPVVDPSARFDAPLSGISVEIDAEPRLAPQLPPAAPASEIRPSLASAAQIIEHVQRHLDQRESAAPTAVELPSVEQPSSAPPPPSIALPVNESAAPEQPAPAAGRSTEGRRAVRAADARQDFAAETWRQASADSAIAPTARAVVAREAIGTAAEFAPTPEERKPAAPPATPSLVQAFAEAPSQAKPVADITVHDATPGAGPATTDEPALADQIVQSLRLQLTSGGGEAQLRLRPEYLGELTVKVVVEDGVVSARLEAAAPAVREWVERHEGVLRQALADHGLSLDTLSVHESAPADDANQTFERHSSRGEEREDERPRRRRQATGSWGRFAVDTDESDAS